MSESSTAWKAKATARRVHQLSQIPVEWRLSSIPEIADAPSAIPIVETSGLLTPLELEITSLRTTAVKVLSRIHAQTWTAEQVVTAFCKRAAILQQLTGCLTEILFDTAIAYARTLDEHLSKTGKAVGPLHGLPLSLKDNHDIKGVDSTVGWIGLIGKPASRDFPAVEEYRRMGAVFYVKTNVPQSLMMSDSYNHVFGQCVNALNRNFISGGSSGGEGALVAGGGSVIGVGTDIGGSVRIPAGLCGLYGLSPTVGRVGNRESIRNQKYMVPPVAGPLARSIDDLEVFLRAYWGNRPWERDPGIFPIPWRTDEIEQVQDRKLRIACLIDDGVVKPQPPIERAIKAMMTKLEHAGHEIIQWDGSSHQEGYDLWLRGVLADGGKRCADLCKIASEPLIKGMLVGQPENLLDAVQRTELADQIFDFQSAYMKKWSDLRVDALIMPNTQWVGLRPKHWVESDMYVGYTSIWNLMNWTSLAIPVTTVSKEVDQPDEVWKNYAPRSASDKYNHDYYNVDSFEGLPVGLQLVTGRFGEEKAIAIARIIASL